jgi:N6-L-threonylcarbamoyladenine synthase
MLESGDFDFSFSGLKTSVGVYLREHDADLTLDPLLSKERGTRSGSVSVADVCASFQAAVVDTLVTKTLRAVGKYRPASVILAGGVAANRALREALAAGCGDPAYCVEFFVPQIRYSGDNAAMIAAAGYFRALRRDFVDPLSLEADPNMRLV